MIRKFYDADMGGTGDCSNHRKDLFGETDMKVVAEAIGDLHYETLAELLGKLSEKLLEDGKKDFKARRYNMADQLFDAYHSIQSAQEYIGQAYQISKPFMNQKEK